MALVLKADTSTIIVPKVIETKNGMIFNGHYYNKSNLTPVAFEYLIIDKNCVRNMLNTNKRLRPSAIANCSETWNEDTIIADEYESNIFYSIIYNVTYFHILKYKEIQNKIELITSSYVTYYDKYLGQDEKYLYYSLSTSSYFRIYKIDKQKLGATLVYSAANYLMGITTCMKIFENDSYIYFGYYGNNNASAAPPYLNIIRLIKDKNSTEDIKLKIPMAAGGVHNFFNNKDTFKIANDTVGFYLMSLTDIANPLKLIKLNLNEAVVNNIVSIENVTFTWNEDIKKRLSAFPSDIFYAYETFITNIGDKSFLNIIMYQTSNQYVTAQVINQGLYTFEITNFNSLELTNYNQISDSVLKGYLLSKDRNFIVVSTAANTVFMKFDVEAKCYKITNTLEGVTTCIGLDLSERVWIMKADNEVDVYSLSNPTDFNMKFEKDYYDYVGDDIETFITIEAKNFLGEYINTNVELSIDGNAKFKDNTSSVIKISTPSDGKLNIPVIITGSNQITVYPKILTEGENS